MPSMSPTTQPAMPQVTMLTTKRMTASLVEFVNRQASEQNAQNAGDEFLVRARGLGSSGWSWCGRILLSIFF